MLDTIKPALGRRLGRVVRRLADNAASLPPVSAARDRSYDLRLAAYRPASPRLAPALEGVRAELEDCGVAARPLARLALTGSDAMLAAARRLLDAEVAVLRARAAAGAPFLAISGAALLREPELYRFGASEPLLDLAEAYLGLPVAYDGVAVHYTPADGAAVATRDWHRDREDRRVVKLCVYLNDVGEEDGPFELIPDAGFGRAGGFHMSADEAATLGAGGGGRPICCTGPAETAVFADTARYLHRGRPATGRERAAVFFSYFARAPHRPHYCNRSSLSAVQVSVLSAGLSPRQQAAAAWRGALPLVWRLIPAAPV